MKKFYLDLKVIAIGLVYASMGWGLPDGHEFGTGSVEAKSNEPLSRWMLV